MTATMTDATTASAGIEGYREYLVERDGAADLLNRTLSRREPFFADIAKNQIAATVPVDRSVFLRNLRRRRPETGLSPQMYWLLATAKLNQAERFGVGLGETYGINSQSDLPLERVYLELEEHYHTRLLAYVLEMFDLPFQTVAPSRTLRQFVKTTVFVPRRLSTPFVGAAEMAGCALFAMLGSRGVELFADEPEVAERIRLLYNEILTDEIGHVGYCAASCSRAGRATMRRLYPIIGRFMAHATPEIAHVLSMSEVKALLDAPFDLDRLAADLATSPFVAHHP